MPVCPPSETENRSTWIAGISLNRKFIRHKMARTLLATLPAAALALRATRTTVSMHTNIFPTFTIKDKAAVLGQRPIQAAAAGFFFLSGG